MKNLIEKNIFAVSLIFSILTMVSLGSEAGVLPGPQGESYLGLGSLKNVIYDPFYNSLLAGGSFGIYSWDIQTGKMLTKKNTYDNAYRGFILSADGRYLFRLTSQYLEKETRNSDGSIITVQADNVSGSQILGLTPDNQWILITGSGDGRLRIWNTETLTETFSFEDSPYNTDLCCISSKSNYLLATSNNYTNFPSKKYLKLWSLQTGKMIRDLNIDDLSLVKTSSPQIKAGFSFDESQLLTYGPSMKTQLTETESGKVIFSSTETITQGLLSKDNSLITVQNGQVSVRRSGDFTILETIPQEQGFTFTNIAFWKNEEFLQLASINSGGSGINKAVKKLSFWNRKSHSVERAIVLPDYASSAALSPENPYLLIQDPLNGLQVLNLETENTSFITFITSTNYIQSQASATAPFTEDGNAYIYCTANAPLAVYEATSTKILSVTDIPSTYLAHWLSIAQGRYIVKVDIKNANYVISIYDIKERRETKTIELKDSLFSLSNSVWLSPDAKTLLGIKLRSIEIWDIATAAKIQEIPLPDNAFNPPVKFTSDGKSLLLPYSNGYQLCDVQTGKLIQTYKAKSNFSANAINISEDGSLLALSNYSTIEIYNLKTGSQLKSLKGFLTNSYSGALVLRFSPDNHYLLFASSAKSLLIDLKTDTVINELHGYPEDLSNVVFTENGKQLVFVYSDGNRSVWDVKNLLYPGQVISFENQAAYPGMPLQLPVNLINTINVTTAKIKVQFDPKRLKFNNVQSASSIAGATITTQTENGLLTISLSSCVVISGRNSLLNLVFDVIAGAKDSSTPIVEIIDAQFNDGGNPAVIQNGRITLFEKPFRWGDLNGDGLDGTVDHALILQWLVEAIDRFPSDNTIIAPQFPIYADLNGDGKIGTIDAALILQKKVNLITRYPADSSDPQDYGPELQVSVSALRQGNHPPAASRIISFDKSITNIQGDMMTIPILINTADEIFGFHFKIKYNPVYAQFINLEKGHLLQTWENVFENRRYDSMQIAACGFESLSGSGSLVVLHFRLKQPVSPDLADITIEIGELNDGSEKVNIQNYNLLPDATAKDWFLY